MRILINGNFEIREYFKSKFKSQSFAAKRKPVLPILFTYFLFCYFFKTEILKALTHYRPAMLFGNRKNILEDLFSSVLS